MLLYSKLTSLSRKQNEAAVYFTYLRAYIKEPIFAIFLVTMDSLQFVLIINYCFIDMSSGNDIDSLPTTVITNEACLLIIK